MDRVRSEGAIRIHGGAGFALPLLLALLLALTALAHGALVLARRQVEVAGLSARLLQAEHAAEAGVAAAEAEWWRQGGGEPVEGAGTGVLAPEVAFSWRAVRLAPEVVLVEAEGSAHGSAPWTVARAYWRAHPETRASAVGAALEVGGALEGEPAAVVTVDPDAETRGEEDTAACGSRTLPPLGTVAGLPPDEPEGAGPPRLGLLDGAALLERLGPGVLGPSDAAPPQDAAAVAWEDPGGLGVRVLTGDLRIPEGVRGEGLFLVGGELALGPGAVLVGAARVRGGVRLSDGALVVGDRCAVQAALEAAPTLAVPLPVPGGSRLPIR